MTARVVFAAGLLVGSATGAVLTATNLRPHAPEPVPVVAPARQVERIPIDVAGTAGTCELTYHDGHLTEIECAPNPTAREAALSAGSGGGE